MMRSSHVRPSPVAPHTTRRSARTKVPRRAASLACLSFFAIATAAYAGAPQHFEDLKQELRITEDIIKAALRRSTEADHASVEAAYLAGQGVLISVTTGHRWFDAGRRQMSEQEHLTGGALSRLAGRLRLLFKGFF